MGVMNDDNDDDDVLCGRLPHWGIDNRQSTCLTDGLWCLCICEIVRQNYFVDRVNWCVSS